jgi:hypothetical protein
MFLRNRLLALLHPSHDSLVAELSAQLTRRCQDSVWKCIRHQAGRMSRDMARGYVRAHAIRCVAAEMDAGSMPFRGGESLRPQVAAAAVAQLIALTLKDMASVNIPTCLRAAAA